LVCAAVKAAGTGSAARLARARLRGGTKRRVVRPTPAPAGWRDWLLATGEALALSGVALIAVITALGRFAEWFVGAGVWSHLLPFAAAVLGLAVATGGALWVWLQARRALLPRLTWAPLALALGAAAGALWFALQPVFLHDVEQLQALIGGQAAAERAAIGHQVFAAYRRAGRGETEKMFERGRAFEPAVREAAETFGLDADLLTGLAATESSFRPRTSADGGRGLFQITAAPVSAQRDAAAALGVSRIDLSDPRHNAFVGAATLRLYLDQMRGDLFLGLLAYNIGPANGGLRAIMDHYGARDFVTIQPYLQQLPRDYPIRVLSAALAHRLWRTEGHLPAYEEGTNAIRVQGVGIPGL
ncbi:MAG: transglycosylase SLT domain-containing protein, partial [bacterium]